MQRDSVISLRPAQGQWRRLRDLAGVDPDAVYGCVDWYPYHDSALATREPSAFEQAATPGGAAAAVVIGPSG
jgi:hypothetical protein